MFCFSSSVSGESSLFLSCFSLLQSAAWQAPLPSLTPCSSPKSFPLPARKLLLDQHSNCHPALPRRPQLSFRIKSTDQKNETNETPLQAYFPGKYFDATVCVGGRPKKRRKRAWDLGASAPSASRGRSQKSPPLKTNLVATMFAHRSISFPGH